MKKIMTLALACAAMLGNSAIAQEVTYVEDPAQGYTFNRFKDNWFITAEGGVNYQFSKHDVNREWSDRFAPAFGLQIGKWFSPIMGFRGGATYLGAKGLAKGADAFGLVYDEDGAPKMYEGYYKTKVGNLGVNFDALLNVTNWWCGYKPDRVYNLIAHGGAGAYWTWQRNFGDSNPQKIGWHRAHNTIMFANAGLMNSFRLSSVVDLFVDVQYTLIDFHGADHDLSLQAGLNFNLGKSDWDCPVTAVCPTWKYTDAEGDALVAKLKARDQEVAEMNQELETLRARKPQVIRQDCEGLVTVYYPINQSGLSAREKTVLKSVAQVMKENTDKRYKLTGYADSYTGTDAINDRLRQARVDGVYNYLVSLGVDPAQLDKTTDDQNLTDLGPQAAPLDRAVTVRNAD